MCIYRTIISMDMKLDFVPPWMINFISRQVAGQGLKLYQKVSFHYMYEAYCSSLSFLLYLHCLRLLRYVSRFEAERSVPRNLRIQPCLGPVSHPRGLGIAVISNVQSHFDPCDFGIWVTGCFGCNQWYW